MRQSLTHFASGRGILQTSTNRVNSLSKPARPAPTISALYCSMQRSIAGLEETHHDNRPLAQEDSNVSSKSSHPAFQPQAGSSKEATMSPLASTSQPSSASLPKSTSRDCSSWSEVASALEAAQLAPAAARSYQNVLDKTKISLERPSNSQSLPLDLLSSVVAYISHTAKREGASNAASQEAIALQWSTGLRTSTEARYHVHLLEMWDRLDLLRPALRYLTEHIPLQALSAICRDPTGLHLILKLLSLTSPCPCNLSGDLAARSGRSREMAKEKRSAEVLAQKLQERLGKVNFGRVSSQDLDLSSKQRHLIRLARLILVSRKSTSNDLKIRQQSLLLLLQCCRRHPCESCLMSLYHPDKVSKHVIDFVSQHLECTPSFVHSRPQLAHHLWQVLADVVVMRPLLFKAVVRGAQNSMLHDMLRHPSLSSKHFRTLWKEGLRRRQPDLVRQVLDCISNTGTLQLPDASFRSMHASLDMFRLQQPAEGLRGIQQISRLASSQLADHPSPSREWAHAVLRRCAALATSLRACAPVNSDEDWFKHDWTAVPARSTRSSSELEHHVLSRHRQRIQTNAKISILMRRRRGYRRKLRLCARLILQSKAAGHQNNSVLANIISQVLLENPHWTSKHIWQFLRHALKIRIHPTMSAQEWHDLFAFMRMTASNFAKRGDVGSTRQAFRLLEMLQEARES